MNSVEAAKKCGTIALVGSPNAGKSTLINSLVGQKIVGVSTKPQTTRNRVLGIVTAGVSQFLFVDTPGIHRSPRKTSLNSFMNREAWDAVTEAHVVCLLLPVHKKPSAQDLELFRQLMSNYPSKILLLFTQSDRMKKSEWKPRLLAFRELLQQQLESAPLPPDLVISAKQKDTLQPLIEALEQRIPEGPWQFDPEQLTDRPTRFVVQELIRESLFRHLGAEVPYQCAVKIESIDMQQSPIFVQAAVLVTRESLKALILGKNGTKIKEIGSFARQSLESMFEAKVFLELFVRIQADWDQDLDLISEVLDEGLLS